MNFIFSLQNIKDHKTDVLVFWTSRSLLAGDESFLEIHSSAGSSLKKEVYNIKYDYQQDKFNFGDNIITKPGILLTDKLIHSVLPNYRVIENKKSRQNLLKRTFFNISKTIEEFEKQNYKVLNITILPLSSKIYGDIEKKDIKLFFNYISQCFEKYHSVTILFNSEDEKNQYERIFKKVNKNYFQKVKEYARNFGFNIKI
jgi:O-acetyl-ADP-ribose deacetylase (regulator of RNase III)